MTDVSWATLASFRFGLGANAAHNSRPTRTSVLVPNFDCELNVVNHKTQFYTQRVESETILRGRVTHELDLLCEKEQRAAKLIVLVPVCWIELFLCVRGELKCWMKKDQVSWPHCRNCKLYYLLFLSSSKWMKERNRADKVLVDIIVCPCEDGARINQDDSLGLNWVALPDFICRPPVMVIVDDNDWDDWWIKGI